ncbi:MAG: GAF domain-containing protein, partial [Anaerolineae bacterium]
MARERILIVEPDETRLNALSEQVLQPGGYNPLKARTLNRGLALALAELPHAVLLHLPPAESAGLLRTLQQAGHVAPVILMLDADATRMAVDYLRLGVRDYVTHPFAAGDVLAAVRRVLEPQATADQRPTGPERMIDSPTQEFSMFFRIGQSINSLLDLDLVLNRVTEAAVFITGSEEGYLLLHDEATDTLRLRAAQNLGDKQAQGFSLPVADSIAGTVVRNGRPILLSGNHTQSFKVKSGHMVRSLLNVPLKIGNRVIGVLGVANLVSNAQFTSAHLYRLSLLADVAATALENARQYTETRKTLARRIKEVSTLQTVISQLGAVADFDVAAQLALSLILKATNAEAGVLAWLSNGDPGNIHYTSQGSLGKPVFNHRNAGDPPPDLWWDEETLQQVLQTGTPVLMTGPDRTTGPGKDGLARSRLAVPMRRGKEIKGVINLESASEQTFSQNDLNFMLSLAGQVAVALNGTILQQQAQTDRQRLALLMQTVDNAVWLLDARRRLVAQNKAAETLLGWPATEAVGRSVCDLMRTEEDTPHRLCRLFEKAIKHRQAVSFDTGIVLLTRNEQPVLVGGRIVPILQNEYATGAMCAFWRLSTPDGDKHLQFEFANMASHLLRTPLSFIQTSIDLLIDSKLESDEQRLMLDKMREEGHRLTGFANELLKMLRLETKGMQVHPRSVAGLPLLERALKLVQYDDPRV